MFVDKERRLGEETKSPASGPHRLGGRCLTRKDPALLSCHLHSPCAVCRLHRALLVTGSLLNDWIAGTHEYKQMQTLGQSCMCTVTLLHTHMHAMQTCAWAHPHTQAHLHTCLQAHSHAHMHTCTLSGLALVFLGFGSHFEPSFLGGFRLGPQTQPTFSLPSILTFPLDKSVS